MLLIATLVPFLLSVRLVVNHGARATLQALLFAIWLIILFSLVATPFFASLVGAAAGACAALLLLTALSRAAGAAYIAALVGALLPPLVALTARNAVAYVLERSACENSGRHWDKRLGECREHGPPSAGDAG